MSIWRCSTHLHHPVHTVKALFHSPLPPCSHREAWPTQLLQQIKFSISNACFTGFFHIGVSSQIIHFLHVKPLRIHLSTEPCSPASLDVWPCPAVKCPDPTLCNMRGDASPTVGLIPPAVDAVRTDVIILPEAQPPVSGGTDIIYYTILSSKGPLLFQFTPSVKNQASFNSISYQAQPPVVAQLQL